MAVALPAAVMQKLGVGGVGGAVEGRLRALRNVSVCDVCVLRVLGVRSAQLSGRLCAGTPHTATQCPACLGLLHHAFISRTVASAVETLRAAPLRGASSFLVSVKVPVQLALRARAFALLDARASAEYAQANPSEVAGTDGNLKFTSKVDAAVRPPKSAYSAKKNAAMPAVETFTDPETGDQFSLSESQVEVKEVLRNLLTAAFAKASNLKHDPSSLLQLELAFEHPETTDEYQFMEDIEKCGLTVRKRRRRVREGSLFRRMRDDEKDAIEVKGASWNNILTAASQLSFEELNDHGFIEKLTIKTEPVVHDLKFMHSSLWIAGRYNKYQRGISNSRMEVKGQRLAQESMEELIAAHVDTFFKSASHKFSSAGREDVDVLMLGTGRPFYMEIVNPRILDASAKEIDDLQKAINEEYQGKIRVTDLQLVDKHDTSVLKESAATKKKSYATVVRLSQKVPLSALRRISAMRDIELKQQTPTRVTQSRSDLVRDKIIHEISIKPVGASDVSGEGEQEEVGDDPGHDHILVLLTTSAGTYVKEFVHSDLGRTTPSLKSLLGVESAVVESLDVQHVHLDWPTPRS
ncbi:putative tRNA pseudouridine synthase Pus10 [Entophlyctis luteolus]|nr:putative tRNA pseudouridine synthase Pus10 [Entophlyctis luteolus]KAJ3392781.1 putative tRNA pseudouridine synthase Pus10 [Entophlyctis sp. JEL0112]